MSSNEAGTVWQCCLHLPRTVNGALVAIERYETANSDLPSGVRRLLAISATGRYFGRVRLESALGRELPRAPFRDAPWRYWNCLNLSNLEDYWDDFKGIAETVHIRAATQRLRSRVSGERYDLFLRRLGTHPDNGHRQKATRSGSRVLWTKGGSWREESPFTQLFVLGNHLPLRPLEVNWQVRLGHDGIRHLERELMNSVNPDSQPRGDCIQQGIEYLRWRMAQWLNRKRKFRMDVAVWFFQTRLPLHGDYVGTPRPGKRYIKYVAAPKLHAHLLKEWEF